MQNSIGLQPRELPANKLLPSVRTSHNPDLAIVPPDGARADDVLDKVVVYASTSRWGSPGSNPGWRFCSSQKHWERFKR